VTALLITGLVFTNLGTILIAKKHRRRAETLAKLARRYQVRAERAELALAVRRLK
jgi:hypothetical protein